MSDIENDDLEVPVQDEMTSLKERAAQLGVKYHPSISLDKLREKVNAAIEGATDDAPDPKEAKAPAAESEHQMRMRLKKEAHKLVRIRVTCMNPMKTEWPGEIFTVGNAVIGSVKKYVPFNTDEGWHVPHIIYQVMKDKMFQIFVNVKTKNGVTVRQGKLIKEYAIEVLPDLSATELAELAQRQAMAKSID